MQKKQLPIDIPLQQGVILESGAVFVVLRTLAELEAFWLKNRHALPYAAKGIAYGECQLFLNEYEWVFAPTKASLIKTVCRWDVVGIKCEWYDWATEEPSMHASWFVERDQFRIAQINSLLWDAESEENYQQDCKKRSPDTYRGWWILSNLPNGIEQYDWFSDFGDNKEELIDPNLPLAEVVQTLQEQTFDDWKEQSDRDLYCFDENGVSEDIAYWRNEQKNGDDYYGKENENPLP